VRHITPTELLVSVAFFYLIVPDALPSQNELFERLLNRPMTFLEKRHHGFNLGKKGEIRQSSFYTTSISLNHSAIDDRGRHDNRGLRSDLVGEA